ncbi:MAG: ATP-binding protein [Deltaproteobacteria bacterium]|nr:ATP-binding protein [Deltaproteobacteria bacterium]
MLLEFRVKNFRSFKDAQVLSLIPSSDTSLQENILSAGDYNALKIVSLFGPNASGKSNLIKAVDFFVNLIKTSTSPLPEQGKRIRVHPFLLEKEASDIPSEFEAIFVYDKVRYQYGFSLTAERIIEEWLYAFPLGRSQVWFTRQYNKKTDSYDWKFGSNLKGGKSRHEIKSKTRDNALYLSVAAQWNNEQLITVYEYVTNNIKTIFPNDDIRNITASLLLEAQDDDEFKIVVNKAIMTFLKKADIGIKNLNVKREDIDKIKFEFPEEMPEEIRRKYRKNFEENPPLVINFVHSGNNSKNEMVLPLNEESEGTKRLFELLGPLFQTLFLGYTVFIDELEASLHPLLMTELLKLCIRIPEAKGQIVFTTHSTGLLRSDLFRRDQIWFTEKDNFGASKLYPLSDYKPRKDEAMEKGYLSGRYGAIPILEEFGINE